MAASSSCDLGHVPADLPLSEGKRRAGAKRSGEQSACNAPEDGAVAAPQGGPRYACSRCGLAAPSGDVGLVPCSNCRWRVFAKLSGEAPIFYSTD